MIQTVQRNSVVLEDGDQEIRSVKMSIDWESEEFLMQTLSKNFYSDGVGSTCRELVSNALDSHRRANVTDIPILVSFKRTNNGNYEFSVEDRGIGLDYDDVINIISKYGKSTARGVEGLLGLMGYGFKSPLSYTSSFIFTIRKDGMERKCMMYDGEEGMKIDLLDEDCTDQPNGVKVIVPVSSHDASDFYKKIKEQLCYFESVYFDVNYNGNSIDNSFKITRYEDFQMSELNSDDSLHLCLDNVYYPLDFKKLEIAPIITPIGLKFGLSDGIFPIPNREQLKYTPEAKAIIIKKIKTVASKLVEMYNKSVEDTDDFNKIVSHYSNDRRYIDIGHKQNVEIIDLLKYSDIKVKEPHLKGISLIDLKKLSRETNEIFSEYIIKYEISRRKLREKKKVEFVNFHQITSTNNTIYKFTDKLGGVKKEYIKSIAFEYTYFIRRKRIRKLFSDHKETGSWSDRESVCYYTLLALHLHPRSEWRARIKEFQSIKDSLEKRIIDADALVIPKAWLDNRKLAKVSIKQTKSGHQKLEGEISCKKAENLERYVDGKSCKFTPFSLDLKKLEQTKMFYIYTNHENSDKLDKLYELSTRQIVKFITFSDREIKRVNEIDVHNLMSYENFMKGENALFKRIITAYLISQLEAKNRSVFDNKAQVAKISTSLASKLDKLYKYYNQNYYRGGGDNIYKAMLEVADKYSLFDYSVYGEYLEVKNTLEEFPFLETIYSTMSKCSSHQENRDRIIVDLLKYNKYKVNLEHYEKKVKEEPKIEENEENDI